MPAKIKPCPIIRMRLFGGDDAPISLRAKTRRREPPTTPARWIGKYQNSDGFSPAMRRTINGSYVSTPSQINALPKRYRINAALEIFSSVTMFEMTLQLLRSSCQ